MAKRSRLRTVAALAFGVGALTSIVPASSEEPPLAGASLSALVADHTEFGTIVMAGGALPYAEYFAPDGTVRGRDHWGTYVGRWTVEGDCLNVDYADDDQFDGCIRYRSAPDGEIEIQRAGRSDWTAVKLQRGNPAEL